MWWRVAIIVVAGILTYANSLSGPFILDDQSTIADNQQIREWSSPSVVLVPEANTAIAGRPIVNLSFALNYAIHGLDVRGYHVANILFHLICGLLVFGIIRRTLELPRMGEPLGGHAVDVALAAALLWVVHPLNSEVVDYLTERTESLMALFYLLTLYASIRAGAGDLRPRRWQRIAVVSCALGMACKESMVTAPLVVVLYDRIFLFDSVRQSMRARRWLYLGLATTWGVLVALMWSGPRASVGGFSTGVPVWSWLLNQALMISHYLRLAVWPRGLVVFYGWPLQLTMGAVWPYAALVVALIVATVVALARAPKLGFLGVWFFITLAPTSSFVPIATEVGAERRMYLPLVALVVLAVVAASRLIETVGRTSSVGVQPETAGPPKGGHHVQDRPPSAGLDSDRTWRPALAGPGRWRIVVLSLLLLTATGSLAAGTFARNREYASSVTLARTVVDRRPSPVTHHYLAEQLAVSGQHEEAVTHLREAVKGGDSRARYLLGIELFNAGKLPAAMEQLYAFVATSTLPYRLVPHWLEPPLGEVITARLVLARAASMQGGWSPAADQARLVLKVAPGNREAQMFLADALFAQQKYEEAATQYNEYLKARPDDVHALTNLGVALISGGNLDAAIELFGRAVAVDPKNANARRMLGMALFDRHDYQGAAEQAREGVALNPNDPTLSQLLAAASAAASQVQAPPARGR